jgi:hypothetical protein
VIGCKILACPLRPADRSLRICLLIHDVAEDIPLLARAHAPSTPRKLAHIERDMSGSRRNQVAACDIPLP